MSAEAALVFQYATSEKNCTAHLRWQFRIKESLCKWRSSYQLSLALFRADHSAEWSFVRLFLATAVQTKKYVIRIGGGVFYVGFTSENTHTKKISSAEC
jgi:hypothetical protein